MESFLLRLATAGGPWVYVVVGALAFGEAAFFLGMVLPGETALLVGGYLASHRVVGLGPMIVVAVLCAIAGDSVGYEVGRLAGPALRRSRLGRRIGEERWQRAEEFLRRHGGKAVLLGRCTALLRALVPGLAGMSRMRYRTFLVWNAAGGIVWGAGCVLLGYAFAQSLTLLDRYLHYASTTVLVLAIGGLVAHRLLVRRRRRAEEAREVQHTASGTSL